MAGGHLLVLSHGYLGAVVRRPAQRGEQNARLPRRHTSPRSVPDRCRTSPAAPVRRVREGITHWRTELLAYFDEPTTNGYAEGVINKVKVIKRRAYGLPTFAGFRKRVVIAVANRTRDATPRNQQVGGRSSALVTHACYDNRQERDVVRDASTR